MKKYAKSKFNISSIQKIRLTNKVRLHIGSIILFLASIILNYYDLFLIAYISAFLHEMGHILCAKRLDVPVRYIEIQPFGIMAKISDTHIQEPIKEMLISFCGPLVSLILCAVSEILNIHFKSELLTYCSAVNLGLCVINLIPCLPLDGGRILKAQICEKYGIITAYNFMMKSSRVILFILSLLCGMLVLTLSFNFSFILILAFLMGNIATEYKAISIITMKEIIYNKQKLYENNINRVKSTVAYSSMPARVLLKHLSYNYYYVINVLDENQRIVATLTETQVIDGIVNLGIGVTLGELEVRS